MARLAGVEDGKKKITCPKRGGAFAVLAKRRTNPNMRTSQLGKIRAEDVKRQYVRGEEKQERRSRG